MISNIVKIFGNLTQTIGNTPMVRINKLTNGLKANVVAKIEKAKPLENVKDRIGLAMIEAAERAGIINHES